MWRLGPSIGIHYLLLSLEAPPPSSFAYIRPICLTLQNAFASISIRICGAFLLALVRSDSQSSTN